MKLLNIDANAKTVKGQKKGYMTAIMYLAPADVSGYEVCPMSTPGCREACLNTAGRGAMNSVQRSRIAKTKWFFENREAFMTELVKELTSFKRSAERAGMIPVVRLNGTSDIPWETVKVSTSDNRNVMELFPDMQFYDYTKRHNRRGLPENYHLTFSLAESNETQARRALQNGMNVVAVFRTHDYPDTYLDAPVIDGDENDLRFLDGHGKIVGLYAKGRARKDATGFVKDLS